MAERSNRRPENPKSHERTAAPKQESRTQVAEKSGPFALNAVFPNAEEIFSAKYQTVNEIKDTCLVGLDANVLLAPYRLGSSELKEIKDAYGRLIEAGRLIIPGQVAREFARHRSRKLADISHALATQKGRATPPITDEAKFLRGIEGYDLAINISKQIDTLLKQFQGAMQSVIDKMKSWRADDPVSEIYRDFAVSVVDLDLNDDLKGEIAGDLAFRTAHDIPPGYQDSEKPDGGVGDLLIWRTILKVGSERKLPFVFVTYEKKNDWWTKGSSEPFHPRFELLDEYRRASQGNTFHLLSFSDFLATFGATKEVVEEVRKVEAQPSANRANESAGALGSLAAMLAERNDIHLGIFEQEKRIEELHRALAAMPNDGSDSMALPWNRAAQFMQRQLYDAETKRAELKNRLEAIDAPLRGKYGTATS